MRRAGLPRVAASADSPTPTATHSQCTWVESGRQCLLPGSTGTKTLLCTWHAYVATHPHFVADIDEFDRWVSNFLETPYCGVWTHYSARLLWRWAHGEKEAAFAQPCELWRCRHRSEHEMGTRSAR